MALKTLISVILIVAVYYDNLEVNGQPILPSRIIGGQNAIKGEYPHLVSLQHVISYGAQHFCAGAILNDRWILTASHCYMQVPGNSIPIIVAGKYDLHQFEDTQQIVKVEKIIRHKGFVPQINAKDDIALLKLEKPLKFNAAVKPIALPESGAIPKGMANFGGWGLISQYPTQRPKLLQTSTFPLLDIATCQKAVETTAGNMPVFGTNICTGPLTGGHAACNGDSGGPLVRKASNGQYEVIGVASWTPKPCGMKGGPTVYTRISAYNDWIQKNMADN